MGETVTLQSILTSIGEFITWFLTQMLAVLSSVTSNPYFLYGIIVLFATAAIALCMRFFKSFGLKRGSRRRR